MSTRPSAHDLRLRLRARLQAAQQGQGALQAPGVYDGYGARMVQQQGFEAVYVTGNGVSAALLGRPDVGLIDLSTMSTHAQHLAACVDVPLICDADNGYGGLLAVATTVQMFEAAGVAAIHIEDQISPKQCAQLPGARLVHDFDTAVARIRAAMGARRDDAFMVIARTDAVTGLGLEEGIRRAQAFVAEGADAVFVELKAHAGLLDDMRRVADAVSVPCVFNLDAGGPLLSLPREDLHRHGVALAIYPALLRRSIGHAMQQALQHLQQQGCTEGWQSQMISAQAYNAVLGLDDLQAWEQALNGTP